MTGLWILCLGVAACLGVGTAGTPTAPPSTPPSASALAVYLDPLTGRLLREPPPGETPLALSHEELAALDRSGLDLVEEPGPVSGTLLHLHGAFQSLTIATVGDDGKIRRVCLGAVPVKPASPEHRDP